MKNKKSSIVVFDFDGTITNKDSFNDFLITTFGLSKFLFVFIPLIPFVIAYKLGLVSNKRSQEIIVTHYFKNMTSENFNKICTTYAKVKLPRIIKQSALEEIEKHDKNGSVLVIVSSSLTNWIKYWARTHKIRFVLGSEAEIVNHRLTGKIKDYCAGKRKATKFLESFPNRKNYTLVSYGDSRNDKYLFKISNKYYFRQLK